MIAEGILLAGLLCTGALIFSHIVFGQLYIVPIINYIMGDYSLLNYNFYANLCRLVLIVTLNLFLNKEIKKITSFILLIIFALGILISTSRMTLLSVAVIKGIEPEIWQTEKNYVLFQRYLPNNTFDNLVNVVGNKAFACRRFVRKNDFRASGSGNWDLDRNNIDLRFVELALKISKELKFQSMAYDFLYDEKGEPKLCEISYTYPDDPETGYWDEKLQWHDFKFLPPYFHLKETLNLYNLEQPPIFNGKSYFDN